MKKILLLIGFFMMALIQSASAQITVLSPNKWGKYVSTTTLAITWENTTNDDVLVEYTHDGTNWQTIGRYNYSIKSINWQIPRIQTMGFKVRVSSVANASIQDQSDEFSLIVYNTISDVTPTYNEKLTPGSVYTINWQTNATNTYKLSYSSDGGSTWKTIHSGPYSGTSYQWTVPNDYCPYARVKVEGYTYIVEPAESPQFILLPTLRVTSPNFNTFWGERHSATVKWLDPVLNATYNIDFNEGWSSVWRRLKTGVTGNSWYENSTTVTTPSFGCDFGTYTARVRITRVNDGAIVYSDEFNAEDGSDRDCDYLVSENTASMAVVAPSHLTTEDSEKEGVTLYPNPVRDQLAIVVAGITGTSNAKIEIYSAIGIKVKSYQLATVGDKLKCRLDVSSLSSGSYLIRIASGNKVFQRFFVKK